MFHRCNIQKLCFIFYKGLNENKPGKYYLWVSYLAIIAAIRTYLIGCRIKVAIEDIYAAIAGISVFVASTGAIANVKNGRFII